MDASYQFVRFKRFGNIVVGSNLQTDNAIRRLAHGTEQDDRHFGGRAHCFQKIESRSTGQHDVKHDQFVIAA